MTEAYGYYLNNTFDQYDYIGNPSLKNESAVEVNGAAKISFPDSQFSISLDASAFFFSNYIIGQFETRLSPMTVGAEGVKVYGNISHATIANASLTTEWQLTEQLRWNGKVSYSTGRDADGDALPLISPVSWQTELQYNYRRLQLQAVVKGNARQNSYGAKYGESAAKAWTICNLGLVYDVRISSLQLLARAGVENLFDRHYATYADWNHTPQKGTQYLSEFNVYIIKRLTPGPLPGSRVMKEGSNKIRNEEDDHMDRSTICWCSVRIVRHCMAQ